MVFVGVSKVPLIYGSEAYVLFSLADCLDSLIPDPVFGIVSIQSGQLLAFKACLTC